MALPHPAPRRAPLSALEPLDRDLMLRVAAGEVRAFAEVYDRHAPAVLALARRMLPAPGDAHDLLHDVFLEAWQCARTYDPLRGSVRTRLVCARSRGLDRRVHSDREQATRTLLSEQGRAGLDGARLPPTERQIAVRQALATLEPSTRQALELTYFEGLTAAEVAARMSTPEGTVKSRLARGLELLERVLRQLEEGET